MDHETESQVMACVTRIEKILGTPIFLPQESRNPFVQSAFIELVILLRDLMHKSERFGHRVSFTDDVNTATGCVDISDVIRHVRDAACHLDSKKRDATPNISIAFMVTYGAANLIQTPSVTIGTKHADDVCFVYGSHHLYLRRHIIRAYREALDHLRPLSWMLDSYLSTSPPTSSATFCS